MLFICYLKEETALKCPFCNYNDTKVIDSRGQEDNSVIRRRRLCERIDMIPITVIKNDGTREIFDKTKIINGVMKSCNKRPVTAQQIQELADDIENTLMGLGEREVESKQIGNMVMDRLKEVDEVAYVRFASVYRQFKDINTFIDELEKLLVEKKKG
jgi:transcriptional repressor NrdR